MKVREVEGSDVFLDALGFGVPLTRANAIRLGRVIALRALGRPAPPLDGLPFLRLAGHGSGLILRVVPERADPVVGFVEAVEVVSVRPKVWLDFAVDLYRAGTGCRSATVDDLLEEAPDADAEASTPEG